MRIPIIAGNWKMNKTIAEAVELVNAMRDPLLAIPSVEKVVCPPFVALDRVAALIRTHFALGGTQINLNVLNHVNRLLGADFDVRDWRHVAFFDARESRIEMHLEARRAVEVRLPEGTRPFAAGERIHTENSYKYSVAGIRALLARAGFREPSVWLARGARFAVLLARPA